MAKCKGTNLVYLRSVFEKRGPEATAAFTSRLSPDELKSFQTAFPITMVQVEEIANIFQHAAAVLYPGDPRGLRRIGYGLAQDNLKGVYRSLLRFATIPFVAGQAAKLWSVYQDRGRARADKDLDRRRVVFTVTDFPELPKAFLEEVAGYLEGVAALTGAKDIRVVPDGSDPEAWRWTVTWS